MRKTDILNQFKISHIVNLIFKINLKVSIQLRIAFENFHNMPYCNDD